ncbi:Ribosomal RNA-processing protein 8 [Sarcoptes scabiei]|uniref:Ribosomal RNA-processing protein 8 n=1 Tax=Sarcoptes scabiei TaxID=52283 RepID=A0A834RI42_SARSC|nr:Ribosomal RNA-processing protein 8 [Sarcoptes scabiei]
MHQKHNFDSPKDRQRLLKYLDFERQKSAITSTSCFSLQERSQQKSKSLKRTDKTDADIPISIEERTKSVVKDQSDSSRIAIPSKKNWSENNRQILKKDTNISGMKFLSKNSLNDEFNHKIRSHSIVSDSKENFDNQPDECSRRLASKAQRTLSFAMFRHLNEFLYTHTSFQSRKKFDESKFLQYHQAYDDIVKQWPLKPIDFIIEQLKNRINSKKISNISIADIGCGSKPRIAEAFPEAQTYSFDLYSSKDFSNIIIAADMCCLPLEDNFCDYCIYSLSLMPSNLSDAFREANRILKPNGCIMIVEVASRFAECKKNLNKQKIKAKKINHKEHLGLENFTKILKQSYGFKMIDRKFLPPNDYFVYLLLRKNSSIQSIGNGTKLPPLNLKPCLYKIR